MNKLFCATIAIYLFVIFSIKHSEAQCAPNCKNVICPELKCGPDQIERKYVCQCCPICRSAIPTGQPCRTDRFSITCATGNVCTEGICVITTTTTSTTPPTTISSGGGFLGIFG